MSADGNPGAFARRVEILQLPIVETKWPPIRMNWRVGFSVAALRWEPQAVEGASEPASVCFRLTLRLAAEPWLRESPGARCPVSFLLICLATFFVKRNEMARLLACWPPLAGEMQVDSSELTMLTMDVVLAAFGGARICNALTRCQMSRRQRGVARAFI